MPICILPVKLANQIAAGEVVERPSSVVKELVENSIDALSSHINIKIEAGGGKLISIRDDGYGIHKEELALALARHATSKISSLDDLERIVSLGFRGEALASISSVSRLTLISRTKDQKEAWQVYTEGMDMSAEIKLASHPIGTTVEVLDLFYNTPVRRKFLRSEKAEFSHIDEVVRRIALAHFNITIELYHNEKLIRQYLAVKEESQEFKRLTSACGNRFLQQATAVNWQNDYISIKGWIVPPEMLASSDFQYCYVNNRSVSSKIVNHAVRQAYNNNEKKTCYILYITLDFDQVDVNVHPAKNEVRFNQSRLVHNFIYKAVSNAFLSAISKNDNNPVQPKEENKIIINEKKSNNLQDNDFFKKNHFINPLSTNFRRNNYQKELDIENQERVYYQLVQPTKNNDNHNKNIDNEDFNFGSLLMIYKSHFAVLKYGESLSLMDLDRAQYYLNRVLLTPSNGQLSVHNLLIPIRLVLNKQAIDSVNKHKNLLIKLGINLSLESDCSLLKSVAVNLWQHNLVDLIPKLLDYLSTLEIIIEERIINWLAYQITGNKVWSVAQGIQLLDELERIVFPSLDYPPPDIIQPIHLNQVEQILEREKFKVNSVDNE